MFDHGCQMTAKDAGRRSGSPRLTRAGGRVSSNPPFQRFISPPVSKVVIVVVVVVVVLVVRRCPPLLRALPSLLPSCFRPVPCSCPPCLLSSLA
eukprot:5349034-Pyramimonas_sp.AAC.1